MSARRAPSVPMRAQERLDGRRQVRPPGAQRRPADRRAQGPAGIPLQLGEHLGGRVASTPRGSTSVAASAASAASA